MEDGSEYLIVFSTVPSVEVGTEIARDLVENMIAACVNIVPRIKSVYEWNGEYLNWIDCAIGPIIEPEEEE